MKYNTILLLIAISLISFSSFCQSFSNKTIEELETMKKEAITSENYDLANKISEEQKARVSIDDKIVQLDKNLKVAVANENFDEAEKIKKEIKALEDKKITLKKLEEEKKAAILIEDFDKVIALEKQINDLKNDKKPTPIAQTNSPTKTSSEPNVGISSRQDIVSPMGLESKASMSKATVVINSNEITPNGDGVNDFLIFKNLESYPNNNLIIMYKSNIIYKTTNYQNNWNGETQIAGTYHYNLRTKGGNKLLKGTLILNK